MIVGRKFNAECCNSRADRKSPKAVDVSAFDFSKEKLEKKGGSVHGDDQSMCEGGRTLY